MISATLDIRDYQHFLNLHMFPESVGDLRVLHGVEADIVDLKGHLFGYDLVFEHGITGRAYDSPRTLKDVVFSHIDYAIASVHDGTFAQGATVSQVTDMYVGALADPKVAILGHIGRSGLAFDVDAVLTCARDLHKLVEINDHSFNERYGRECHDRCRHILERAAELGVTISCATDAHIAYDVGDFSRTERVLDEVHFPEDLNACTSADRFLAYLPA